MERRYRPRVEGHSRPPEEARDVSEVYVDGTLVLVRSRADELVTVGRKQLDDEAIAEAVKIMGGDGDD